MDAFPTWAQNPGISAALSSSNDILFCSHWTDASLNSKLQSSALLKRIFRCKAGSVQKFLRTLESSCEPEEGSVCVENPKAPVPCLQPAPAARSAVPWGLGAPQSQHGGGALTSF